MRLNEEKRKLTKMLMDSDNEALIRHLKAVADTYNTDLWDELSDYQKRTVEEARQQLKNGEGVNHEEARKRYVQWLGK